MGTGKRTAPAQTKGAAELSKPVTEDLTTCTTISDDARMDVTAACSPGRVRDLFAVFESATPTAPIVRSKAAAMPCFGRTSTSELIPSTAVPAGRRTLEKQVLEISPVDLHATRTSINERPSAKPQKLQQRSRSFESHSLSQGGLRCRRAASGRQRKISRHQTPRHGLQADCHRRYEAPVFPITDEAELTGNESHTAKIGSQSARNSTVRKVPSLWALVEAEAPSTPQIVEKALPLTVETIAAPPAAINESFHDYPGRPRDPRSDASISAPQTDELDGSFVFTKSPQGASFYESVHSFGKEADVVEFSQGLVDSVGPDQRSAGHLCDAQPSLKDPESPRAEPAGTLSCPHGGRGHRVNGEASYHSIPTSLKQPRRRILYSGPAAGDTQQTKLRRRLANCSENQLIGEERGDERAPTDRSHGHRKHPEWLPVCSPRQATRSGRSTLSRAPPRFSDGSSDRQSCSASSSWMTSSLSAPSPCSSVGRMFSSAEPHTCCRGHEFKSLRRHDNARQPVSSYSYSPWALHGSYARFAHAAPSATVSASSSFPSPMRLTDRRFRSRREVLKHSTRHGTGTEKKCPYRDEDRWREVKTSGCEEVVLEEVCRTRESRGHHHKEIGPQRSSAQARIRVSEGERKCPRHQTQPQPVVGAGLNPPHNSGSSSGSVRLSAVGSTNPWPQRRQQKILCFQDDQNASLSKDTLASNTVPQMRLNEIMTRSRVSLDRLRPAINPMPLGDPSKRESSLSHMSRVVEIDPFYSKYITKLITYCSSKTIFDKQSGLCPNCNRVLAPPRGIGEWLRNLMSPKTQTATPTNQFLETVYKRSGDKPDLGCGSVRDDVLPRPGIFCNFSGLLFCVQCTTRDELVSVPSRIVSEWDFSPLQVSRPSAAFLRMVRSKPTLLWRHIHPAVKRAVPALMKVNFIRHELIGMREFFLTVIKAAKENSKGRVDSAGSGMESDGSRFVDLGGRRRQACAAGASNFCRHLVYKLSPGLPGDYWVRSPDVYSVTDMYAIDLYNQRLRESCRFVITQFTTDAITAGQKFFSKIPMFGCGRVPPLTARSLTELQSDSETRGRLYTLAVAENRNSCETRSRSSSNDSDSDCQPEWSLDELPDAFLVRLSNFTAYWQRHITKCSSCAPAYSHFKKRRATPIASFIPA